MKDNIELFLSLIAIFISFGAVIYETKHNSKINKLNMESEIYKNIFFKYFIYKIPKAQQNIKNTTSGLTGTNKLETELNKLRHEALFFLYRDEAFYRELCNHLQSLEDYIVRSNNTCMNEAEYNYFFNEVKNSIKNIFNLVMNKYEGLK